MNVSMCLLPGMKNREERVIGSELQPAIRSGDEERGGGGAGGTGGLSFFEEEEEVEVLVDKGQGRAIYMSVYQYISHICNCITSNIIL